MIIPEFQVKEILKKYGLSFPYGVILKDPSEYNGKFPVVLKISSKNITHKTEAGAVVLDIKTQSELAQKFKDLKDKFPGEEIYAEEMHSRGIEIIVGLINDKNFGKMIMLGLGGFYAELIRDVTFKKVPIEIQDAEDMISELRYSKIFEGYRNLKTKKEVVIDLLLKISRMAEDMEFQQVDFNPIFLYEDSYIIIDSKMVV